MQLFHLEDVDLSRGPERSLCTADYEEPPDPRMDGIRLGDIVRITNVVISSTQGQASRNLPVRERVFYRLTAESTVEIIEHCQHAWEHHCDVYDLEDEGTVCWARSHCGLCGAWSEGIEENHCPDCGERMELAEDDSEPHHHCWFCDDCGATRPIGWSDGELIS